MKNFTKPATSPADQLLKLKSRGLIVADDTGALRRLRHVGYYRLSAYMLPFQEGGRGPNRHQFVSGATFDQIINLYVFDRKLRLLFLEGMERIEISVRAALSAEIAVTHGAHWYEKRQLFTPAFNHDEYLEEIDRQLDRPADVFLAHYYKTYTSPGHPPSWMLFECMSFGVVSTTVSGLFPKNAGELVRDYGIPHEILGSWLHSFSYVRNLCAHHSRLWNRTFTLKPRQTRNVIELTDTETLYAQAVVLFRLLTAIVPDTDWAKRLAVLLDEYPAVPLDKMGFPDNWRERPFWKPYLI